MKQLSILLISCLILTGCASIYPVGSIYTGVKIPNQAMSVDDIAYTKVGTSKCISILALVAVGDASIDAAVKSVGIKQIKYIDYSAKNILGIYGEYIITVYGD